MPAYTRLRPAVWVLVSAVLCSSMGSRHARVLGVLDGRDVEAQTLGAWARSAEVVLAADGAADRLLEMGVLPTVVIGDLDSFASRKDVPRTVHDPDQGTSDADKLLAFAFAQDYGEITLIGVEGDRLDHVLATLASAARSPLRVRLVLRTGLGWIVSAGRPVRVALAPDDLVSLIPLETCSGVCLTGVCWPLSGATLTASGLVSLSNRAIGHEVGASAESGAALLAHVISRAPSPVW